MARRPSPAALKPRAKILFLPPLSKPSPYSPWLVRLLPPPPLGKLTKLTHGFSRTLSSALLVNSPSPPEIPQVRFCLIWPSDQVSTLTLPTSQPCIPAGLGTWRFSWSSPAMPLLLARWWLPLYHHISPKDPSRQRRSHVSHMSCVMCAPWSPSSCHFLMSAGFCGMLLRTERRLCALCACFTHLFGPTVLVMSHSWFLAACFPGLLQILILFI
uniref:ORF4 protein n=1 Tax=Murine norovirus TaxID=357231 RepID=A0A2D1AZL0_NORV|nr:ORF4 protein [Murine norovirus]